MNQHQRKFLLEAVEKQYKTERDSINERRPKAPSLNNYLIAAILDGSFVLKSADALRDTIRQRVRAMGKEDSLIEHDNHFGRRNREDEDVAFVKLPAEVVFDLPPDYATSLAEYEIALAAWEKELADLETSIGAMRIKIQIGSDKALDVLVEQADKLCSMSLTVSSRLLLGNAT